MPIPSGVSQPNQFSAPMSSVTNSLDPAAGPRTLSYACNFTLATSYIIDLTSVQQAGRIGGVQTAFVDNSQNSAPTTLQMGGTSQPVSIPAGTQAYVPILAPMPTVITVESTGSANVYIALLNFPLPFSMWYPADPHNSTAETGAGVDASANAPALAAHIIATISPNLSRKGWVVQNQSADTVQVALDDGIGGTATIILLAPGSGAGTQGASIAGGGMPHLGRIRVAAPNVGDQVAVRSW